MSPRTLHVMPMLRLFLQILKNCTTFWDMTSCKWVNVPQEHTVSTFRCQEYCHLSFTLKIEAEYYSETLEHIYPFTRCHITVNRKHDSSARASDLSLEQYINSCYDRVISSLPYISLGAHKFRSSVRNGD